MARTVATLSAATAIGIVLQSMATPSWAQTITTPIIVDTDANFTSFGTGFILDLDDVGSLDLSLVGIDNTVGNFSSAFALGGAIDIDVTEAIGVSTLSAVRSAGFDSTGPTTMGPVDLSFIGGAINATSAPQIVSLGAVVRAFELGGLSSSSFDSTGDLSATLVGGSLTTTGFGVGAGLDFNTGLVGYDYGLLTDGIITNSGAVSLSNTGVTLSIDGDYGDSPRPLTRSFGFVVDDGSTGSFWNSGQFESTLSGPTITVAGDFAATPRPNSDINRFEEASTNIFFLSGEIDQPIFEIGDVGALNDFAFVNTGDVRLTTDGGSLTILGELNSDPNERNTFVTADTVFLLTGGVTDSSFRNTGDVVINSTGGDLTFGGTNMAELGVDADVTVGFFAFDVNSGSFENVLVENTGDLNLTARGGNIVLNSDGSNESSGLDTDVTISVFSVSGTDATDLTFINRGDIDLFGRGGTTIVNGDGAFDESTDGDAEIHVIGSLFGTPNFVTSRIENYGDVKIRSFGGTTRVTGDSWVIADNDSDPGFFDGDAGLTDSVFINYGDIDARGAGGDTIFEMAVTNATDDGGNDNDLDGEHLNFGIVNNSTIQNFGEIYTDVRGGNFSYVSIAGTEYGADNDVSIDTIAATTLENDSRLENRGNMKTIARGGTYIGGDLTGGGDGIDMDANTDGITVSRIDSSTLINTGNMDLAIFGGTIETGSFDLDGDYSIDADANDIQGIDIFEISNGSNVLNWGNLSVAATGGSISIEALNLSDGAVTSGVTIENEAIAIGAEFGTADATSSYMNHGDIAATAMGGTFDIGVINGVTGDTEIEAYTEAGGMYVAGRLGGTFINSGNLTVTAKSRMEDLSFLGGTVEQTTRAVGLGITSLDQNNFPVVVDPVEFSSDALLVNTGNIWASAEGFDAFAVALGMAVGTDDGGFLTPTSIGDYEFSGTARSAGALRATAAGTSAEAYAILLGNDIDGTGLLELSPASFLEGEFQIDDQDILISSANVGSDIASSLFWTVEDLSGNRDITIDSPGIYSFNDPVDGNILYIASYNPASIELESQLVGDIAGLGKGAEVAAAQRAIGGKAQGDASARFIAPDWVYAGGIGSRFDTTDGEGTVATLGGTFGYSSTLSNGVGVAYGAGYAVGNLSATAGLGNALDTVANSFFGLASLAGETGAFSYDVGGRVGISLFDHGRVVNDNLAPGGQRTISSNYNAPWASIGAGFEYATGMPMDITPFGRAAYTVARYGAIDEGAGLDAVQVDSRTTHIFDAELGVKASRELANGIFEYGAAAVVRSTQGSDVTINIFGTDQAAAYDIADFTAGRVFAGYGTVLNNGATVNTGASFTASGKAHSFSVDAKFGLPF